MHYKLETYDEDFDLINEELPDPLLYTFGDQLDRARVLLEDRSQEEIRYAIESLDWMLRKGSELLMQGLDEAFKTQDRVFASRVKALQLFKESIDLDNQTSFPNATWSDYFAILTMAYVVETLHLSKLEPIEPTSDFEQQLANARDENIKRFTVDHAIECMDAVSHAEGLFTAEQLWAQTQTKTVKQIGKKGLKIKAQKYDDIKRRIIQQYLDNHKTRSNREAARRIYEALKDDIDNVLSSDDPKKQVEKWIGQFKNGKLKIELVT